jgi:AcrR family transcriptional regulator
MDRSPVTLPSTLTAVEGGLALPALPMLDAPRAERADATRNRLAILEAAERLVAARGVESVTMDEVACAAGVGKGTLFRHFGDRSGLLHALLDQHERSFQDDFIRGPAPLGPGAPVQDRIVAFGERVVEQVETQGQLLVAAEHGAPGQRLRHSVYLTRRALLTALLERTAISSVQDPGYLADVLLGALAAELVLYQRQVLGMSQEQIVARWKELVCTLVDCGSEASSPS